MDYALLESVTNSLHDDSDEETSEQKKLYFMASALGHINRMKEFLDGGINIETKDYVFGETIFIRACRYNHIDVLEFIHCRDANVNTASNSGETALHIAVKNSSLLCVEYLLSIPEVEIDYPDKLGQTPLMISAFKGHVKCVELLLTANCDVLLQDCHGRNALHRALDPYDNILGKNNACLCVQVLTRTNCNINQLDLNGDTPLHIAIKKHNWKAVKWLVSENCDVDKKGQNNQDLAIFQEVDSSVVPTTPLVLALNFLNRRIVQYLVYSGCYYHEYSSLISYCQKDVILYQYLQDIFSHPKTLKDGCKIVIRKCLGRPIHLKINSLYLPEILRDFILLQDAEIT